MIKRVFFYLILLVFISHNIGFFLKMLVGEQPRINIKCPLAISFINTPLLFDRGELFFNTQFYKLTYPEEIVSLTRRDIRKGLFSYFDMLYFSHWGKYFQMAGANAIILDSFFCHENAFMKKMKLTPPEKVERQIFDIQNKLVLKEIIECRK